MKISEKLLRAYGMLTPSEFNGVLERAIPPKNIQNKALGGAIFSVYNTVVRLVARVAMVEKAVVEIAVKLGDISTVSESAPSTGVSADPGTAGGPMPASDDIPDADMAAAASAGQSTEVIHTGNIIPQAILQMMRPSAEGDTPATAQVAPAPADAPAAPAGSVDVAPIRRTSGKAKA